jgi:nucleotide-binding universal stress UspA family protein
MTRSLNILIPIDFSQHSLATLTFALSWRHACAARYTLLHVVASGDVEAFAYLGRAPGDLLSRQLAEAAAALEREAEQRRQACADLTLATTVCAGVPFREICQVAEREAFDLIVIGSHGRTGLSHLLIGSTAERVVQHASCPVLSVKPRIV